VTATYFTDVLGLEDAMQLGPFFVVAVSDSTTLDFVQADGPVSSVHFAFLVSEGEFDAIFARIVERDQRYWADPGRSEPGINHWDGGRGVYFDDPNGHLLEIITRRYGSGGSTTDRPHPLVQ
jgi:catechol 2,3-dioxygenase-like lactoylglutathione lyase family enzyme